MTTIDDLNQSISTMTNEELMTRLQQLRKARRTKPAVVNNPKPKKPSQLTAKYSLAAILKTLSADELSQLLGE